MRANLAGAGQRFEAAVAGVRLLRALCRPAMIPGMPPSYFVAEAEPAERVPRLP